MRALCEQFCENTSVDIKKRFLLKLIEKKKFWTISKYKANKIFKSVSYFSIQAGWNFNNKIGKYRNVRVKVKYNKTIKTIHTNMKNTNPAEKISISWVSFCFLEWGWSSLTCRESLNLEHIFITFNYILDWFSVIWITSFNNI